MGISTYDIVYIITNIFETYIIYRFMNVFFNGKEVNKKIELLSYLVYSIFIAEIYLLVNIPIILLICNIIAFIGLSLNYKANVKKRILSVLLIYLILVCTETIVVLLSGYLNSYLLSVNNYSSIYGLISIKVISFLVVLLLENYKNIKKGETIPNSNWFCIILIPLSSLYIILILFQSQGLSWNQVMIGIVLMLLVNFSTFHLYDALSSTLSDRMDKILFAQQNEFYENQLNLMKSSLKASDTIKHDLTNHLYSIYTLVENGEIVESLKHISKMVDICNNQKRYSHSRNINIDSILNFKLKEAEQKNIKISVDLNIPEKIDLPSFDMAIILGNLLDNAINATSLLEEKRYINIKIKYDKGRFIVKLDNSYKGEILKIGDKYLTTQRDKTKHGIGIESIKNIMHKYNGSMEIKHNETIFSVTLLLFI